MLKLSVALAALTVLTACNRSAPDREVAANQAPREQQDVAGATQPLTADSAVSRPSRVSPARASGTLAERHSAARVHKRRTLPPRTQSLERPDSASASSEVSAQAGQRGDSSVIRDSSVTSESSVSSDSSVSRNSVPATDSGPSTVSVATRNSSTARDSSSSRDSSASSDTLGYKSYPGTTSTLPASAANMVAAGTVIPVSLEDSVDSRVDTWGKQITGKVMQNVTGPNGEVLVGAGSPLRLTVTRIMAARGHGKGAIEILADSITVDGRARKLEARIESVPYELRGRGVTGEDAAKVGVGAAGGAVVGGVVTGKTKGAVIGGVVGAAAGAAVASQTSTKDVVVAARTQVQVVLTAPLIIR
jgi:hypothetical protein